MKIRLERYTIHAKKAIKIAIPIVVAEAGTQLTHVADSIMVGNVSALHLAASSLANYIFLIPLLFGMGSTMAITPLAGTANGKQDLEECKTIFSNAFFLQLANGILLTCVVLAVGLLIPLLDSDAQKTALAQSYFNYLALSTLPIILLFTIKSYFDGFGFTVYGMIVIIFGNAINVFFNWILIYGKLGFPALALDGAGIATLISRICMLIFFIFIAIFTPKLRKIIELPKLAKVAKDKIINFYKIGFNVGVQTSVEIAAFSLIVIFAGWLGITSAAAYQIAISISGIAYLSAIGIGAASTVLISTYNGARQIGNIIDGSFALSWMTTIFMFLCSIILVSTRFILPPIFVNEYEVIEIASTLILMLALFQIPDGLNVTFTGILRGLLDTKIPMIINSISFWALMIPLAYFLAFKLDFGIYGVMLGVVMGIFVCAIAIFVRYRQVLKTFIIKLRTGDY
jgi:multidrug resistance protein, MATE family